MNEEEEEEEEGDRVKAERYHSTNMGSRVMIFVIAIVISTVDATLFQNVLDIKDKVFGAGTLYNERGLSILRCAGLCSQHPLCVAFTHFPEDVGGSAGQCRGHSRDVLPFNQIAGDTPGAVTYGGSTNVALFRPATQSSATKTYYDMFATASLAVDGIRTTANTNVTHSCSQTKVNGDTPHWWQVDLENTFDVLSLTVTNREGSKWDHLGDIDIDMYMDDPTTALSPPSSLRCLHFVGPVAEGATENLACVNAPTRGRYVRITARRDKFLSLCEVQVMALLVM